MLVPWLVKAAAGGNAVAWGEGGRAPSHELAMAGAAGPAPLPMLLTTPSRMLEHWTSGPARPARWLGTEGLREAHLAILPYSAPEECEEGEQDQVLSSKVARVAAASLLLTVEPSARRR